VRLGHRAYWQLSLYPQAAEGGGCFVPTLRAQPVNTGAAVDRERAQAEAARRARAKVRRYCAASRLNRLGTLTYAGEGCFDQAQLRVDLAEFFRGLRRELGGEAVPYLWVPEWHPGGHGLHAHFAVGRYVPQRLLAGVWGRGIVHIKLIGDLPVGSGALEEARVAAGYLGKYVAKNVADERIAGLHRYEVAQGFQPERVQLAGDSEEAVVAQASELMGGEPVRSWRSSESEGWRGPPAYWYAWAGR
jgi:hypothetical protein